MVQADCTQSGGEKAADADALAVIIGRAGSKGLPGKNIRSIADRPMVWYSLERAARARCVRRIVVSSDSPTLLDQAAHCPISNKPVTLLTRPPELAGDAASVQDTVRHAVAATGETAPIVVVLYVNVPVRPADLIDRAVQTLLTTKADSVQSYVPSGKHHPWWQVRIDAQAGVTPWAEHVPDRRQDLPPAWAHDGGVIVVTREALLNAEAAGPHGFLGPRRAAVVNAPGDVVDIDDAFDLRVAEAILSDPGEALHFDGALLPLGGGHIP